MSEAGRWLRAEYYDTLIDPARTAGNISPCSWGTPTRMAPQPGGLSSAFPAVLMVVPIVGPIQASWLRCTRPDIYRDVIE